MYLIGLDIGGTKCAATLGRYCDGNMEILEKEKFPTMPPEESMTKFIELIRNFSARRALSLSEIAAVGISCGSPLDAKTGRILSPPNLSGWDDVPIVDRIEASTHIPAVLQNDANACAVAEWKLGAGRGTQNMIFLTFGTGLGAGLILNGMLYDGTNGNAGETGHVRLAQRGPVGYGKIGSFEGFCSGGGIAQLGKTYALQALQSGVVPAYCPTLADMDGVTAKSIADAAYDGDKIALEVYRTSGEMLGVGLSMLVDILNPERIVIGSIFARSRDLLFEACDAVMKRECLPFSYEVCEVVPAELGENIGDYAALSLALSKAQSL